MNKLHCKQEVARLFTELIPIAMNELRYEIRKARTANLSLTKFRILAYLNRNSANNKELAENQGVSVAAMSRMIDQMVAEKSVERTPHKTDRRQTLIKLTKTGEEKFNQVKIIAQGKLTERFGELGEEKLIQIKNGLEALGVCLEHIRRGNT